MQVCVRKDVSGIDTCTKDSMETVAAADLAYGTEKADKGAGKQTILSVRDENWYSRGGVMNWGQLMRQGRKRLEEVFQQIAK